MGASLRLRCKEGGEVVLEARARVLLHMASRPPISERIAAGYF
jgi:hypothetical protein